jgi:transketolase
MLPARQLANAIRALSMDAVQHANSGHPGMPMGMADIAQVLWNEFLVHNPNNPSWPNRDRFILSNGHGSMLQYALLHLTGYDLTIEDLKQFRQLDSRTPGHPEYGYTPGVETTTGPLGQGIANGVGMALAEKHLAAQFNRDGLPLIDHYTYVFMGDGCLMEGLSHEACSLAGTLQLNKLIAFWDDNGISIDGEVHGWFTENIPQRFKAYGWHVIEKVDGHNADSIRAAIKEARQQKDKPTLICCKTIIGFGSPNMAGTADSHGSALGDNEIALTRKELAWNAAPFEIPAEIYQAYNAKERGQKWQQDWETLFAKYEKTHPELAAEFTRRLDKKLPAHFEEIIKNAVQAWQTNGKTQATRKSSQQCIELIAPHLPELLGGSADLSGSNLTFWSGTKAITAHEPQGNYIYYGVREFAMSAIMNGLALYGGIIPYGGTFLVFSDYARNAVRLSALMHQRVIYVYTHDSVGLGEDGPTHQPIEHLSMLRLTPNMSVWRPCDSVETLVAWNVALERKDGPTSLIFSRQNSRHQARDEKALRNIVKGAYILQDCANPQVVLIGTGTEVEIAVDAARLLAEKNIAARVVSMPNLETFLMQEKAYQTEVIPVNTFKVSIEAGATPIWYQLIGEKGMAIGIDNFGKSAPGPHAYKSFNLTAEDVVGKIINKLGE